MPDEDIVELTKTFKSSVDEVKGIAEDFKGKFELGEKVSESAKQAADEALTKLNELGLTVADLQQKAARRGEQEDRQEKSIGSQFVESEGFKRLIESGGRKGRASFDVKANITSSTTNAAGSAGALVDSTRLPGVLGIAERTLTIRDLIMTGNMDGNLLEYVRETGFTNNAGMVAEGAVKPQSDLKFDMVNTSPKVIAHYIKASRQILDDSAQLKSYIDGRLRYGLKHKEEMQLLNGDGTGQNLLGIIPQATAYLSPITMASATKIDKLRLAMLQSVLAEYPASGHVLNPIDWADIELTKDTTGNYILANPQGTVQPTMWGLPVVQTQAIASGKFLTGAFNMGAQVFDRWQSRVEVATENEDDFIKNMVTILCEERLALAVYRPESFVYGSL